MSLTDFVDIVSKFGTPEANKVTSIKERPDYEPAFDFIVRCARGSTASPKEQSAFEDTKAYELTEQGKQFVHYSMNGVVQRVSGD